MVAGKSERWILPGDGTESGETPYKALERDVLRNHNQNIIRKNYTILFSKNIRTKRTQWIFKGYQLRYIIRAKGRERFKKDIDRHAIYHRYVAIKNLDRYLKWEETTKFIQCNLQKELLQLYEEKRL